MFTPLPMNISGMHPFGTPSQSPLTQGNLLTLDGSPMMFGSPMQQQPNLAGMDASHPFAYGACTFGGGMFPESGIHFPTAAAQLYASGFTRSAATLLECGLTFYGAGLDQARQNPPDFRPYKASPSEISSMPPPAAMALFGQCCLMQGEHKRAIQYLKTALTEFNKLKRSATYASNPQVKEMTILTSPEREWTISLIDAYLACQDDAQAQKVLEQMYTASLTAPQQHQLPVKYILQLAKMYATPPAPTSAAVPQPYLIHNPRAAIAIHTKLIQQQPLAIESALELIKLGTDPRPIVAQSFASNFPSSSAQGKMHASLKDHCLFLHLTLTTAMHAHAGRFMEAIGVPISAGAIMDENVAGGLNFLSSVAPRSAFFMEMKAHLQCSFADTHLALRTLERLHSIDPYSPGSMDLLGLFYMQKKKSKELITLMAHTLRVDDTRQEPWCVAACSSALSSNTLSTPVTNKDKSLKYLEKALCLHAANSHRPNTAYLSPLAQAVPFMIKGFLYLQWEQHSFDEHKTAGVAHTNSSGNLDHASSAFRKALVIDPKNHLATLGLAEALTLHALISTQSNPSSIGQHTSFKNAVQLVSVPAGLPEYQKNPRIFTNYGIILSHLPEGRQKAAKVLHKAIQIEHEFSDAVIALADMYCASQQYQDALQMLLSYTKKVSTYLSTGGSSTTAASMLGSRDYFLVKIASIYALKGDLLEAMRFYKQALATNPTCLAAQEGIQKLEADAKDALDAEMGAQEE